MIEESVFDLRKERGIVLWLGCVWCLSSFLSSCYRKLFPPNVKGWRRKDFANIIKVFTPTDAQFFKRGVKICIKTAPTCFGVIAIIRERTI